MTLTVLLVAAGTVFVLLAFGVALREVFAAAARLRAAERMRDAARSRKPYGRAIPPSLHEFDQARFDVLRSAARDLGYGVQAYNVDARYDDLPVLEVRVVQLRQADKAN